MEMAKVNKSDAMVASQKLVGGKVKRINITDREVQQQLGKELAEEAKVTKAPRAMAAGVTARTAPQSSKAFSDAKARADKATKALAATPAKGKPAAPTKAKAAPKAAAGANRKYKPLMKESAVVAREGTWRRAMVLCALNNKDTDSATACLAKNKQFGATHKMDFRWLAASGYIAWA